MLKSIITLVITTILMASSYFTNLHIDSSYNRNRPNIDRMLYLPSGKFLKGAALSFDEMLSDILWIKTIGYFGAHVVTDKDFAWLNHLLDVTTILDPYFEYPYEFGAILMMLELGDIDSSISILQKGMKNIPKTHGRYWYLPFYTAFNYMYYKKDFKKAAYFLEIASKFPDTPAYLPLLVSRLYANADVPENAEFFLKEMIKTTDNPDMKEILRQRLNIVLNEKNIKILENAKKQFFIKYNKFPETIEELLQNGFISKIPADPMGGNYYISKEDYSIKNSEKSEKLKVYLYKNSNFDIKLKSAE